MSWFIEALRKYAVFSGRSRRKEYWYFVLFVVIISIVLGIIDGLIGTYHRSTGGRPVEHHLQSGDPDPEYRRVGQEASRHRSYRLVGAHLARAADRVDRLVGVPRAGQHAGPQQVRS